MLFLFSINWGSVSGWWTPVCLLLGALYAWVMYRNPVNTSATVRNILAALRGLAVFIIAFLLVSPLVRSVSYQPQKPLVLIAQDNSESVKLFKSPGFDAQKFAADLAALKNTLGDGYDVREYNFDATLHDGLTNTYSGKQTDISAALHQLNDRFVNQNIGAVVMATDGLYNRGADPQYEAKDIRTNIYTIALGDTIPRRDLLIANVNYNKTAFLGNDFEIEVLTAAYQANGESIRLSVAQDGRSVLSQQIAVTNDAFRKAVPIKLSADAKGIHKFTISIAPVRNEVSVQNNTETIYVEVLDARQKILLLYNSPHPDITVIKQAIESNKNYELKTTRAAEAGAINWNDYSLVMLYQPAEGMAALAAKSRVPVWYMVGAQTDLNALNQVQKIVQIGANRQEMQEVFALQSAGFSLFTLSDSTLQKLAKFPPLLAPYGNYSSPANGTPLLKQKIGTVPTPYPLLSFGDESGRREAVMTAEGIWRWQLSEYQTYGSHHAVEELFTQCVQYLTANAGQQRFRVYPAKNVFDEGENILLNAELYNDALELVNTPDVRIDIKNEANKSYSFLFSRNGQSYQLDAGTLPAGEYSYTAGVKLGEKSMSAHGQFTVKALNQEARQSTANHQLLYAMAKQSGGEMLQPSQINRLADLLRKNETIKTVEYEDKHYTDLIDLKWVFVLILLLISTEWFMRKREGI
ncbi:VWA domain-containing protein [Mucilaginibacter mali]|uniref:VWA domain-containing protein n=1 Tax=Mucilaginibacter mali TaxID=2740462 RepID=A0A7D4UBY6_9SPHI|nr:VWA domain-containing protein [Mucilaginibacter mali]QKJ28659.1 VWA domain-containing protein [Mucilaginibacter mali]